jgi:hypothetical protein
MCGKSDADAILESPRPTCRALHVQGDHSHQSLVLRPPYESSQTSHQIRMLSTGVLLLLHNAGQHTARVTPETIRDIYVESLPHPPYSPEFAPCDYHIFGPLKEALGGKIFRSSKESMSGHACSQRIFFSQGIQAFMKRWKTCIERNGDCVDKLQSCTEPIFTISLLKRRKFFI